MTRYLALTVGMLIAGAGVVHGLWTDRWNLSDEPGASAAKLEQVPLVLGDWQGQTVDKESAPPAGVVGTLCRRYVHGRTGAAVTILVVTARPGPACIHTPDACYVASGYKFTSIGKYTTKGEMPSEFFTAPFWKQKAADQRNLRILWSWNATGSWQAPDSPRLAFARYPVLHKLYLIRETATPEEPLEGDPCLEFMEHFQQAFHRVMFG